MALTPEQLRELEAWLAQYEQGVADLDARTVAATWAAYERVDDWTNPTLTLAAAAAAAGTAQAARQLHLGLMAEFTAITTEILTGRRPSVPRFQPGYSRNADPFDVYSRPVFEARDALVGGLAEDAAAIRAQQQAEILSLTDGLLARREAAQATFEAAPTVSRYRRVIRPELSKTGTCGLCVAAASKTYAVRRLMPIHTRCWCTVLPVVSGADPGQRFNLEDMERLYAATPGTKRQDLSRTRYRVDQLDELGPVLSPAA